MHERIEKNIAEIQTIIWNCSTESVIQRCRLEERFPHPDLQAPAKQIAFLIGLLLATDEPPTGRDFTDRDWENVAKPLRSLSWISQIDPSGDWRSCDYYEYSDY